MPDLDLINALQTAIKDLSIEINMLKNNYNIERKRIDKLHIELDRTKRAVFESMCDNDKQQKETMSYG